jgi:broad specificity phosphatase PhoE
MVNALRDINERHEGAVAVVSHGASIAIALAVILDNDWHRWGQYMVDNCSLTELVIGDNSYVNYFNRTEHL